MSYADHEHLISAGAFLYYSTDGISYTVIDDLADVDLKGEEWNESDDTTLQSPDRLVIATQGWRKAEDVEFTCYFHKTQSATLQGLYDNRTPLYLKAVLSELSTENSSGTYFTCQGWIKKWTPASKLEQGKDEKIMVAWVFKRTTKWVQNPGS